MNPFDLPGPPFLAFYAVLAAAVLVVLHLARARGEAGDPGRVDTSDPYLLAHLRGGANHALAVAVVSLVDRKLLSEGADDSLVARKGARDIARRPIEKAILAHFASERKSSSIFSDASLLAVVRAYEDQLRRLGLLPDQESASRRTRLFLLAAGFLVAVSAVKLVLAYQRGRHNVVFLIVLTILVTVVAWAVSHPRLTGRGKRLLEDLRVLFDGVRSRAAMIVPGGGSIELPLLAAVFGMPAVPETGFPHVKRLFRKASDGSATACGSSCGSSSGSGCGGGGGGCGGCGS